MLKRYGDKALEQSATRADELAADGDDRHLRKVDRLNEDPGFSIRRSHRQEAMIWRSSGCSRSRVRIASPEMFPEAEMLPHLICSRPMFIGGAKDEADQHGGA